MRPLPLCTWQKVCLATQSIHHGIFCPVSQRIIPCHIINFASRNATSKSFPKQSVHLSIFLSRTLSILCSYDFSLVKVKKWERERATLRFSETTAKLAFRWQSKTSPKNLDKIAAITPRIECLQESQHISPLQKTKHSLCSL